MMWIRSGMWVRLVVAMVVVTGGMIGGCQSSDSASEEDHGHEHAEGVDRPESLHAAVESLKSLRTKIGNAIEQNRPADAHEPLHEIGNLLKALPETAADTDLPQEDWKDVKAEADKLFDAFKQIDQTFHQDNDDKQGTYESVENTIGEAIAAIEAKLPLTGETSSLSHGDEDDHPQVDSEGHVADGHVE